MQRNQDSEERGHPLIVFVPTNSVSLHTARKIFIYLLTYLTAEVRLRSRLRQISCVALHEVTGLHTMHLTVHLRFKTVRLIERIPLKTIKLF